MSRWDLNGLLDTIDSDLSGANPPEFFETMTESDRVSVKLSKYDGEKTPRKLKTWLTKVKYYCESNIPDTTQWVLFAKQYLTYAAYQWYKRWNPDNIPRPWSDFETTIKLNFYPKGYVTKLIRDLDYIKFETSIFEYNNRFTDLAEDARSLSLYPKFWSTITKKAYPDESSQISNAKDINPSTN
jgi:hypothetical protein